MHTFHSSRVVGQTFLSFCDQAWLSALNLVLGLVLIRLVSKEAYGVYSQVFAAGLLATSVLEALISNPLVNLVSGHDAARRARVLADMSRYQGRITTVLAVLLALLCAWALWATRQPHPALVGLVFGVFIKANGQREYARSLAFLHFQTHRVLALDCWYGGGVLLGLLLLLALSALDVAGIFAVFAAANAGALLLSGQWAANRATRRAGYADTVHQAWRRGRLGLPGAGLAWGGNYSYLYLAAAWLGATAVAELTASRLLLMPISLCVVAWSRVARPHLGNLVAEGGGGRLRRFLLVSVAGLLGLSVLYTLALLLAFPWLKVHVLASKYDAVGPLLILWGIYFAVYSVRRVGTDALLGRDRYGFMLVESVLSFSAILLMLKLAVGRYGLPGAIIAMIAVEIFSFILTWGMVWRQREA
ncbi:lipopolysaccharide biosynthesis protein [Castellaniella caeni]|uniref:lipopolysaccharide biosynthesis protein n=1 Tax=Castellaniella caeni TaxID=266123 RepID=UPI0008301A02|nr:hypothetical protein [Castellaniella caeni]